MPTTALRAMSSHTACSILERHHIAWRLDPSETWLEMLDIYTRNGWTGSEWVPVPRTSAELLRWLGY